ncbi:MAG TPA: hypothetical protein VH109_12105 [Steroidobacteraceae bacterium]|nr:hypothetical protein [Steroidobacteraceae bacterium]
MNSSPLRASEIEALTFIYTPAPRSEGSRTTGAAGRSVARALVGAAVGLVVFVALAWILTPL